VDLLERLSAGEKVPEVAHEWGVSLRAVYHRLVRLRKRFGARTDVHLIALWLTAAPLHQEKAPRVSKAAKLSATIGTNGRKRIEEEVWPRCESCSGPRGPHATDGLCGSCAHGTRIQGMMSRRENSG